jgi:hypothetical protein
MHYFLIKHQKTTSEVSIKNKSLTATKERNLFLLFLKQNLYTLKQKEQGIFTISNNFKFNPDTLFDTLFSISKILVNLIFELRNYALSVRVDKALNW